MFNFLKPNKKKENEINELKTKFLKHTEKIQILEKNNKQNTKRITELEKSYKKSIEKIHMQDKEISVLSEELEKLKPLIEKKETVMGHKTKYHYSKFYISHIPELIDVLFDGTLINSNNVKLKYGMSTLISLKEDIFNEKHGTINDFAKKYTLTYTTVKVLCAGIETGKYDFLFNKWDKIIKNKDNIENTSNLQDKLIKKYKNTNITPYTKRGFYFDGFNFRIKIGTHAHSIICNIIILQRILDNFDNVISSTLHNIDKTSREYEIGSVSFIKLILTLIKNPERFTDHLNYFNMQHNFKLNDTSLFIDNNFSRLTLNDILYIKVVVENTNNLEKTIEKLINHFKEIKPKYIALLCIQNNKLPNNWFKKDKKSFLIEGKEKRKSHGII